MEFFARSGALLGFCDVVRELGRAPEPLLDAVGLSECVLQVQDTYVDYPSVTALLELASVATGRLDFAVLLAQRQGIEVVGALASVLIEQTTVGDALWLLQRNLGFHARGVELGWQVQGTELGLQVVVQFAQAQQHLQLHLLNVALVVAGCGQLQGQRVAPLRVELALQRPAGMPNLALPDALGCPVSWGQPRNAVVYPTSLLGEPVRVPEHMRAQVRQRWQSALQPLDQPDLAQQVRHTMHALLPTGECNLQWVARVLGVHPRSLQMALKAKGSSYGALLLETRLQLACMHLRNSDASLTTLAMDLGYGDLAVFSRHFKRWTGCSPRQWRALQRQGGQATAFV